MRKNRSSISNQEILFFFVRLRATYVTCTSSCKILSSIFSQSGSCRSYITPPTIFLSNIPSGLDDLSCMAAARKACRACSGETIGPFAALAIRNNDLSTSGLRRDGTLYPIHRVSDAISWTPLSRSSSSIHSSREGSLALSPVESFLLCLRVSVPKRSDVLVRTTAY